MVLEGVSGLSDLIYTAEFIFSNLGRQRVHHFKISLSLSLSLSRSRAACSRTRCIVWLQKVRLDYWSFLGFPRGKPKPCAPRMRDMGVWANARSKERQCAYSLAYKCHRLRWVQDPRSPPRAPGP